MDRDSFGRKAPGNRANLLYTVFQNREQIDLYDMVDLRQWHALNSSFKIYEMLLGDIVKAKPTIKTQF